MLPRCLATLAALALAPGPAAPAPLEPLAVHGNHCEVVLPTGHGDEQFLLVLGSVGRGGGPFAVRIETNATGDAEAVRLEEFAPESAWQARVRDLAERQARARKHHGQEGGPPLKQPPRHKAFHLPTRNHGLDDPAAYAEVGADLQAVGKHCQIYLDTDADAAALRPVVDEIVRTFDEEVFPAAPARALDVDRDGRFTILLSARVAALQGGSGKLSGFVRGSDFYRDLPAPYGNQCDLLYLSTALRPGAFLRTVLAHEYTHAVVFSEHVFGGYLPGACRHDEEGWLSESLSHLAEDRHGYSWQNLDYRISAYLNAPERYSLAVSDEAYAKVWRDPGTRGAGYLFLRWCADRCGPELFGRLVCSNLNGVDNLEVAVQTPFAQLFREWSAALAMAGRGLKADGLTALHGVGLRGPLGSRSLAGARFHELPLDGGRAEISLAATAATSVLLHSPAGERSRVVVTADDGADLQVTLIRLPRTLPRLSLRALRTGNNVRLELTAHGSMVRLESMVWERLVTQEDAAGDTSYRPGDRCPAWFGTAPIAAGETRTSDPLSLPAGPVAVRVVGVDAAGRPVAAWALVGSAEK